MMARRNVQLDWAGDPDKHKRLGWAKYRLEIENDEVYYLNYLDLPAVTGNLLYTILEELY